MKPSPKGDPSRQPVPARDDVEKFFDIVPFGRGNAITAEEIAELMGLTATHSLENAKRIIRALAESAVVDHQLLVCADDAGYFKPIHESETENSIRRKRSQIIVSLRRLRLERQLAKRICVNEDDLIGEDVPLIKV